MPKAKAKAPAPLPDPLADLSGGLTPLQQAFCDAYLGTAKRDPTSAYRTALAETGSTLKTTQSAVEQGVRRMLAQPAVVEHLRTRALELAAKARLTQEHILNDIMVLRDMCMGRRLMPLATFYEGELVTGQAHKLDAAGAAKSLELLGRYLGMWTDNVRHSGADGSGFMLMLNLAGRQPPEQ